MASLIDHYELVRGPIPAERWEFAYGWEHAQAIRMDGTGSEVRLYRDGPEGRREIGEGKASQFEFGYGGTGPHDSARAIVMDLTGDREFKSPERLRQLVPEVFQHDDDYDESLCTVMVADVLERL